MGHRGTYIPRKSLRQDKVWQTVFDSPQWCMAGQRQHGRWPWSTNGPQERVQASGGSHTGAEPGSQHFAVRSPSTPGQMHPSL